MNTIDKRGSGAWSYGHEFYREGGEFVEDHDESLDVRKFLNALWRGKLLVAIVGILCAGLASLLYLNEQATYTATARVIFDPERLQVVATPQAVAETDVNRSGLGNQIEILSSSILLQRLIDDLNLLEHPYFKAAPQPEKEIDPRAILRTLADRVLGRGDVQEGIENVEVASPPVVDPVPEADFAETEEMTEARRRQSIERRLINNLDLIPIDGSRVIAIQFTATDRQLAADVANSVASQYIVVQNEAKQDDLRAVLEMIGRRVDELRERLAQSQDAIEEARLSLAREQDQSTDLVRFQLTSITEALAGVRLQIADAQGIYDRAKGALDSGADLWTVQEYRESGLIGEFRRAEIQLLEELAAVEAISGRQESNPQRVVIESRLSEVRRNIRQEAGYIVSALEFQLESLRRQETRLSEMLRELQVTTITQTGDELRIERLEREALASQTIYESFLSRMNEVSEQAKLQTADARVLSAANVPQGANPSRQHRAMIAAGAAGLFLGMCFVLFREFINNAFQNPGDLQKEAQVPLLSAIPQIGRRKNAKQLVAMILAKPRSVLAESIRHLRTTVLFGDPTNTPKVVMVTSSVPAEGKSATSLLFGVTSQALGKSAIVVGCDLRQRPYSSLLGTGKRRGKDGQDEPGFLSLLNGHCTIEDVVFVEPKSGVHILAPRQTERFRQSPADILASKQFANLIEMLSRRYDLVILDSPPALAVTDARLLSRLADKVVYLVRWNSTSRNAVRVGLREIKAMNANVAGCAMTLVSQSKASRYADNEFYYKSEYSSYFS